MEHTPQASGIFKAFHLTKHKRWEAVLGNETVCVALLQQNKIHLVIYKIYYNFSFHLDIDFLAYPPLLQSWEGHKASWLCFTYNKLEFFPFLSDFWFSDRKVHHEYKKSELSLSFCLGKVEPFGNLIFSWHSDFLHFNISIERREKNIVNDWTYFLVSPALWRMKKKRNDLICCS